MEVISTTVARRAALAVIFSAVAVAGASAQNQRNIRFAAMDTNGDGVVTRKEWRGSDRSFRVHDWNGDGILSGDEVRPGARRPNTGDEDIDRADREYPYDDWTARGFSALDHNRDNRITRDEWHFDVETFRRADHDRDGALSRGEFVGEDTSQDTDRGVGRGDRFDDLDANDDGRIARGEWTGTAERFDVLDHNRDGILSREEFAGSSSSTRGQAWTQGRDRGLIDGRQAGKEDKQLRNAWDLEGQRELETADAGYDARFGSRTDYQAGYREGFRRGYREGFGPR